MNNGHDPNKRQKRLAEKSTRPRFSEARQYPEIAQERGNRIGRVAEWQFRFRILLMVQKSDLCRGCMKVCSWMNYCSTSAGVDRSWLEYRYIHIYNWIWYDLVLAKSSWKNISRSSCSKIWGIIIEQALALLKLVKHIPWMWMLKQHQEYIKSEESTGTPPMPPPNKIKALLNDH